MRVKIFASAKILFLSPFLCLSSAFGQSLSIVRQDEANVSLHVSAPSNSFTLQASGNLHLWIDAETDVPQESSIALTNANDFSRFFRLAPLAPEAPPIRVLLIGDSIVADCCGWGAGLPVYFKANATVINYAQPFISTKLFLGSAEFNHMLTIKPNYVLIEYGYWDGGGDTNSNVTGAEFVDNLKIIAQTIRGFNGVPIFVTLPAPRNWDAAGNLIPSDHFLNPVTRQVAAELNAPLIDLDKLSFDLFAKLGQAGCAFMNKWPPNPDDGLHVSYLGAVYVSQLVAQSLPDSLGPYLIGVLDPPPKP